MATFEETAIKELLFELYKKSNSKIALEDVKGIIFHKGTPPGDNHECSICRVKKAGDQFTYYQRRVSRYGYLMRTNAHCHDCEKTSTEERMTTLKTAATAGKIPPKPKPGDICPNCNRAWGSSEKPRNWHRDHDAIKNEFRRWLCGDCNMALHDHRHGKS